MKRRSLSVLLCLCMLLSMVPAFSLPAAATTGAEGTNISSVSEDTFAALNFDTSTEELEAQAESPLLPYGKGAALVTEHEMIVTRGSYEAGGRQGSAASIYDIGNAAGGLIIPANPITPNNNNMYGFAMRSVAFDPMGTGKDDHVAYLYMENDVKNAKGVAVKGTSKISLRVVDYSAENKNSPLVKNQTIAYLPFNVYPENAGAWLSLAAGDFDGDAWGREELAVYVPLGGPDCAGSVEFYGVWTNQTTGKMYLEPKTEYNYNLRDKSTYYFYKLVYDRRFLVSNPSPPPSIIDTIRTVNVRDDVANGLLANDWRWQYYIPAVSLEAVEQPGDVDDLCVAFSSTLQGHRKDTPSGANIAINPVRPYDAVTNVFFMIDPVTTSRKVSDHVPMRWNWANDYGAEGSDAATNYETMHFGSAAAGDLDGDGINEVVVAGYAREKKSINNAGNDDWKLSKDEFIATYFSYNPGSKTYTQVNQPASWVSIKKGDYHDASALGEGIYGSYGDKDMTLSPLDVTCFAERGGGYGESVNIGGIICLLGDEGPSKSPPHSSLGSYSFDQGSFGARYAIPTETLHKSNFILGDGDLSVNNRLFTESVAANLDGNVTGQEQLVFSYLAKREGKEEYSAFYGFIGQADPGDSVVVSNSDDGDWKYEDRYQRISDSVDFDAKYIYKEKRYAPLTVAAADVDDDSIVIRHTGQPNDYYFSDPHIIAVLQASPYFKELNYIEGGRTLITNTQGDSSSEEHGFTLGVSVWGGMSENLVIASTETRISVSSDFSRTYGTGQTTSFSLTFTSGLDNSVALVMTPYVRYHYEIFDVTSGCWKEYKVDVPQIPRPSIITVDDYDKVAMMQGWQTIGGNVLNNVPGYPSTYDSSSGDKDDFLGGKPVTGLSGVSLPDDFIRAGAGSSSITQTISKEKTKSINMSWGVTVSAEQEVTYGGALFGGGFSAGYTGGSMKTSFTGSDFVGEVASIPSGNKGYGFSWKFGTWMDSVYTTDQSAVQEFPVLGYLVKEASKIPSQPQNLHVSETTETSVTLKWEQNPDVQVGDHYVVYRIQNGVYFPLRTLAAMNDSGVSLADNDGWMSFTDEHCDPNKEYRYAVLAFRNVNHVYTPGMYSPVVSGYTAPTGGNIPRIIGSSVGRDSLSATVTPATGSGTALVYQWQTYDPGGGGWKDIRLTGFNTNTLSLRYADKAALYRCQVSQRVGTNIYTVYTRAMDPGEADLLDPAFTPTPVAASGLANSFATTYSMENTFVARELPLTATYQGSDEYSVVKMTEEDSQVHYYLSDGRGGYYKAADAADVGKITTAVGKTQASPAESAEIELDNSPVSITSAVFSRADGNTTVGLTEEIYHGLLEKLVAPAGTQASENFDYPLVGVSYSTYTGTQNGQPVTNIYGLEIGGETVYVTMTSPGVFTPFAGTVDEGSAVAGAVPLAGNATLKIETTNYTKYSSGGATMYQLAVGGQTVIYYGGTAAANAYVLTWVHTDAANTAFAPDKLSPVTVWAKYYRQEQTATSTLIPGDTVTLKVTSNGKPTGKVSFIVANNDTGAVQQIVADLVNGVAQASWTPDAAGKYSISYRYAGDANFKSVDGNITTSYTAYTNGTRVTLEGVNQVAFSPSASVDLTLKKQVIESSTVGTPTTITDAPAANTLTVRRDGAVAKTADFELTGSGGVYTFKPKKVGVYEISGSYEEGTTTHLFSKTVTVVKGSLRIRVGEAEVWQNTLPAALNTALDGKLTFSAGWSEALQAKFTPYVPDLFPDTLTEAEYVAQYSTLTIPTDTPVGSYGVSVYYDAADDDIKALLENYKLSVTPGTLRITAPSYEIRILPEPNGDVLAVADKVMNVSDGNKLVKGSELTFTANPAVGYEVSGWLVNGVPYDEYIAASQVRAFSTSVPTTITIPNLGEKLTVQALFTERYPMVNYNAGTGGTLSAHYNSASGATIQNGQQVTHNAKVVFVAAPSGNKVVEKWTLGGVDVKNPDGSLYSGSTYTIDNAVEDIDVTVSFEDAVFYTVEVSAIGLTGASSIGGRVSMSPSGGEYAKGAPLTLTATPNTNWNIREWRLYSNAGTLTDSSGGKYTVLQGSQSTYEIYNLQGNMDVRVVFVSPPSSTYEFKFGDNITAKIGGTDLTSGQSYAGYVPVTLTATTGEKEIASWTVNGNVIKDANGNNVTDNPFVYDRFYGNTEVTVQLRDKPTVTWTAPTGGMVSVTSSDGEIVSGSQVASGTELTITAAPNSGYTLQELTVNGNAFTNGDKYVVDGSALTISATFTYTGGGGGVGGGGGAGGGGGGGGAPGGSSGDTVPVIGGTNSIQAEASVTDGTATLSLEPDDLQEVIGPGARAGDVALYLTALKDEVNTAVIPIGAFAALSSAAADPQSGMTGLTLHMDSASVSFDPKSMQAVSSQTGGGDVTVSVTEVDPAELDNEQKTMVGDRPVYDVTVLSGNKPITNLNGGSITVSIPYTPKAGENTKFLVVWYLNEKGELEAIPCTYANGAITFVLTHLSEYIVAYFPFTDVPADAWYYGDVAYAYMAGLMNGVGDDLFDSEGKTSRAMIVTILHRLEGEPASAAANPFTDVADGQWYTSAVIWAAQNKIVEGYDPAHFGPNDYITREQMATILYRYAGFKGYDVTATADLSNFTDEGKISTWALSAMKWANASELINGVGNDLLDPGGNAQRCQVAAILHRFCEGNR